MRQQTKICSSTKSFLSFALKSLKCPNWILLSRQLEQIHYEQINVVWRQPNSQLAGTITPPTLSWGTRNTLIQTRHCITGNLQCFQYFGNYNFLISVVEVTTLALFSHNWLLAADLERFWYSLFTRYRERGEVIQVFLTYMLIVKMFTQLLSND